MSYKLKPVAGGVEVRLQVIGMTLGTATAKSMQKGGEMILRSLKSIAETGRPTLGIRLMCVAFSLLEFILHARTKREHWPM